MLDVTVSRRTREERVQCFGDNRIVLWGPKVEAKRPLHCQQLCDLGQVTQCHITSAAASVAGR